MARFLWILLFLFLFEFVNCLDVYMFKMGHGNATLIIQNKRAMLVDCGGSAATNDATLNSYQLNKSESDHKLKIIPKITSLIGGCDELAIVISHKDTDHYNMLMGILQSNEIKRLKPNNVISYVGGKYQTCTDITVFYKLNEMSNCNFIDFSQMNAEHDDICQRLSMVRNFFGENSVSILYPSMSIKTSSINEEEQSHETDLIVKINYAGRSMLFPGDIGRNLLAGVKAQGHNLNVNMLQLAHHGSNATAELQLIDYNNLPDLITISENPYRSYSTLSQFSVDLSLNILNKRIDLNNFYAPHNIATFNKMSQRVVMGNTPLPLFITGCAENLYYKLHIDNFGTMILTDGDEILQFVSLTKNNQYIACRAASNILYTCLAQNSPLKHPIIAYLQNQAKQYWSTSTYFQFLEAIDVLNLNDEYVKFLAYNNIVDTSALDNYVRVQQQKQASQTSSIHGNE